MKYPHFLLPAVMAASSVAIAADSTDDRITALENEINILKSQNESRQADAIRFNGFFSVGATTANNSMGYAGSNHTYDFEELTKLGLQAVFDVTDSTSVTAQALGKGSDDFNADLEWAYVSHTFENDSTLRAGKLRIPLYMYSDFLDVGIAQPWARPPLEVYDSPFSAFNGIDYQVNTDLNDSTLGLQVYTGQSDSTIMSLDSMFGGAVTWSTDTLTLRGTYVEADSTGGTDFIALIPSGTKVSFAGLGASYDDGQFFVIGELTQVKIDGQMIDTRSAYATLGYRIDAWAPYITIATAETTDNDKRPNNQFNLNVQRDAYSLGTKYNFTSNTALKVDVTHITDFGDTKGVNGLNDSLKYDNSTVSSVRLDTVF